MEGVIVRSNSSSPLATTPFKRETQSEFPSKQPKMSLNNTHEPVSIKLIPKRITEAHLNYLCEKGRLREAIAALDSISERGSKVRTDTFNRLIKSCTQANSIHLGRKLHNHIGLVSVLDPFTETKLLGMYAKCGSFEDARKVFDEMRERNLYTWSAMIGACSREQRWKEVVGLFYKMVMGDGIVPDYFLFTKILQACGKCGDVETGRLIHSIAIRSGMSYETRLANSILAVYAKCGRLDWAKRFFWKMEVKNKVSWNSIITGYCLKGEIREARKVFDFMREEGIEPNLVTWNILITSYNQSGNFELAMEMMEEMQSFEITPDVVTWTTMISGLAQNNRVSQALEMFGEMLLAGVEPNEITVTAVISACASLKALPIGVELHSFAVKIGCTENVLVGNSLIDMYSKCGKLDAAQRAFDLIAMKDVYSWNSMIGGYCQAGYLGKAHDLFSKMQISDVPPNVVTWNTMITGYMRNGDEDQGMDLFQKMVKDGTIKRDTASWNTVISGYLQNGNKNKALGIFRQMQSLFVRLNSISILSLLPACANLIAVKKVKEIHGCVLRRSLQPELAVANSLIDSYAKSGTILYSRNIFDGMSNKDVTTWNRMIAGYVLHGHSCVALNLFDLMEKVGLKPNGETFVSIISACGPAGMVDEGKRFFSSMTENYNISPDLDHYLAMIHLFGRSGRLEEAIEFVKNMAIEPDFSVWSALLTAGRIHGNTRLVVLAGERLLGLKPGDAFIQRFVLQTCASCGISADCLNMRNHSTGNETKESLGLSWIELRNRVHTFVAGDQSKTNSDILYPWIRSIARKIRGCAPRDGLCIQEEEKEETGGVHSEKLAIAFALFGTPQASQCIRVVNSLRICGDCHQTAKFISRTYRCEIYLCIEEGQMEEIRGIGVSGFSAESGKFKNSTAKDGRNTSSSQMFGEPFIWMNRLEDGIKGRTTPKEHKDRMIEGFNQNKVSAIAFLQAKATTNSGARHTGQKSPNRKLWEKFICSRAEVKRRRSLRHGGKLRPRQPSDVIVFVGCLWIRPTINLKIQLRRFYKRQLRISMIPRQRSMEEFLPLPCL
ncbi:hypothetical protein Vadar_008731 [Vaccinium darrowii]|uniref:Uncharacterized protein n=1 Tax=Vaccinium darrowii TaxID=229202 RepID=A0ACB7ZKE1_9ERIC|nr:hypothetical protein Vadar_008731 [Vaccinium darrowii]